MNIPKEQIEQWIKEGSGYTQTAQRASEWTMQQLVGVDMEPVAVCGWGGQIEHLHEGPKSKLVGAKLYTATQLAAARLQGAESQRPIINGYITSLEQCNQRIAELEAENANLCTVMMAAAVEIQEHWDAHCDAEGYGPANLVRRLENGYPEQYGYDAQTMVRQDKRIAELEQSLDGISQQHAKLSQYCEMLEAQLCERSKRKPLTDEQIVKRHMPQSGLVTYQSMIVFARSIEAAHGIGEKQ